MAGTEGERIAGLLLRGTAQLAISLDDRAVEYLTLYCRELSKWNRKTNLVAKNTSLEELVEKHFLDSLTMVPVLDRLPSGQGRLLDVGSGAGFPGLVVKVARPSLAVTLLEPRERRAVFLRHIVRLLALADVAVDQSRIEGDRVPGENYGVITGRGVAAIPEFLQLVAGAAGPQTVVICLQGFAGSRGVQPGMGVGSFVCSDVIATGLPFSGDQRFLLLFRKSA